MKDKIKSFFALTAFLAISFWLLCYYAVYYKKEIDQDQGNGIELYCDRPKELAPKKLDGSIDMFTRPSGLRDLLSEL